MKLGRELITASFANYRPAISGAPLGFAGKYFTHAASIRYGTDRWEARIGVTNIFDRAPPKVDGNEGISINNAAIGNGCDLDGREIFASVKFKF